MTETTKKELLEIFQSIMNDTSIEYAKEPCLFYSPSYNVSYDHWEVIDRLSIKLEREIKEIKIDKEVVTLVICDNENIVHKYRNKARYDIENDDDYKTLCEKMSKELNIDTKEAGTILCGYGMF